MDMMETTRKEMGKVICSNDAAQIMMERFGSKESQEVEHLMLLCGLAKNDKKLRDEYVLAVKEATGDNFMAGRFANAEHYRRATICKASYVFAAEAIARHNSFVKRNTGLCFLTRRYDYQNKLRDCEEMINDFMVYATQVCVEVYLNVKAAVNN